MFLLIIFLVSLWLLFSPITKDPYIFACFNATVLMYFLTEGDNYIDSYVNVFHKEVKPEVQKLSNDIDSIQTSITLYALSIGFINSIFLAPLCIYNLKVNFSIGMVVDLIYALFIVITVRLVAKRLRVTV